VTEASSEMLRLVYDTIPLSTEDGRGGLEMVLNE